MEKATIGRCIGCGHNDEGYCRKFFRWAFLIADCDPRPLSGRVVLHVQTGITYRNAAECAQATGYKVSAVNDILSGKHEKTRAGNVFRWIELKKQVILHVETGKQYNTPKDVQNAMGIKQVHILRILGGKSRGYQGNTFKWVEVE